MASGRRRISSCSSEDLLIRDCAPSLSEATLQSLETIPPMDRLEYDPFIIVPYFCEPTAYLSTPTMDWLELVNIVSHPHDA